MTRYTGASVAGSLARSDTATYGGAASSADKDGRRVLGARNGAVNHSNAAERRSVADPRVAPDRSKAAGPNDTRVGDVVLVSLANGYNQYLATRAEYALQHYEGASTLYGPGTAEHITALMRELAERLPPADRPSPPARVPPITLLPWGTRRVFAPPDAGPPPDRIRRTVAAGWEGDTLVIRWNDVHPGRLVPADGPILRIDRRIRTGWARLTWDDDRALEVWAIEAAGGDGYRWEARWSPLELPVAETRVVLMERPGLPEAVSTAIPPPGGAPSMR